MKRSRRRLRPSRSSRMRTWTSTKSRMNRCSKDGVLLKGRWTGCLAICCNRDGNISRGRAKAAYPNLQRLTLSVSLFRGTPSGVCVLTNLDYQTLIKELSWRTPEADAEPSQQSKHPRLVPAVSVVEESGVESCQEISSLKRVGQRSSYLLHVASEAKQNPSVWLALRNPAFAALWLP